MSLPLSAMQKTIFDVLSGDATLTGLLGANKILDRVPDTKAYPYVTIGDISTSDRGNHTWDGILSTLIINVWSREPGRGRKDMQAIQTRIDQLLHKQDVCIEDWNIVSFRRVNCNIVVEADNVTYHGVQSFNLLLGEV